MRPAAECSLLPSPYALGLFTRPLPAQGRFHRDAKERFSSAPERRNVRRRACDSGSVHWFLSSRYIWNRDCSFTSYTVPDLIMPSAVTMRALITCAAVALSLIHAVTATDYVVGSPDGGWDGKTNYKAWSEAQTFAPGDTLSKSQQFSSTVYYYAAVKKEVELALMHARFTAHYDLHAAFKYNSYHNVLEVTKHAFDECITTNPVTYDTSGTTTVLLTMPGKRYFICGGPGHCLNGMKMEIEVADRPAPTTPSPPPPLPPPPPPPAADHARTPQQPAPAPSSSSSWAPAPAPAMVVAAPPTRDPHKKKHKKKGGYCPPNNAPARAPTVQSVEADFPEAMIAPMSSPPPPPTSGGPAVLQRGKVTVALAAGLGGFLLLAL
ncbi:hypothetical protein PR202_ga09416 [Eleusine coracana subsp. coracana]|uniref:Phytocyanin domain-containing protein n=1 Tax=Eleusine coracana subsp. coracana TaxID=191504 RepID=A0AAV5C2Y0_ELECO|nr:hypothetical protein PR202_ga09416 [Eleusine coracana subsp. coracana]